MERFLNYIIHVFVTSAGIILALAILVAPVAVPTVIVVYGGSGWWFLLVILYFPAGVIFYDICDYE